MGRRDEVQHWLALREREHLTYRELSQRCGIPRNTLAHWAWRLRHEGAEDPPSEPAFVELSASLPPAAVAARVEIVTRTDRRLVVDATIEPELLERLVTALERC